MKETSVLREPVRDNYVDVSWMTCQSVSPERWPQRMPLETAQPVMVGPPYHWVEEPEQGLACQSTEGFFLTPLFQLSFMLAVLLGRLFFLCLNPLPTEEYAKMWANQMATLACIFSEARAFLREPCLLSRGAITRPWRLNLCEANMQAATSLTEPARSLTLTKCSQAEQQATRMPPGQTGLFCRRICLALANLVLKNVA